MKILALTSGAWVPVYEASVCQPARPSAPPFSGSVTPPCLEHTALSLRTPMMACLCSLSSDLSRMTLMCQTTSGPTSCGCASEDRKACLVRVRLSRTMLVRQEVLGPICCTRCTLLAAHVNTSVLNQFKLLCVQLSIVSSCCIHEQCRGSPMGVTK